MTREPPPAVSDAAPLGERPAEDELALTVAQARVAAKLFGVDTVVALGRYRLLDLVGRGGMGVVWGAWDPELERKVAIKLIDPLRVTARDRLVDEARAHAKLAHPNVVPIYDVGVVEGQVYLVMEWVAGENLRAHLQGRHSVDHILDLYLQAARGLAAVHAAGLVHRDFKPENAMVGADGRVRVLDFGLARADISDPADVRPEVAGTPRYMAPEQLTGSTPTHAVDQYAFCVALQDALEARDSSPRVATVPRWLAAVIARGTAALPSERYPSIDAMISALRRDPRRTWRRRIVVGGTVVVAIGAFAIGRSVEPELCAGTATDAGVTKEQRARVIAHLDGLGGFAASARPALTALLDAHEHDWRSSHRAACLAHESHELPTTLYERRLTCLARAAASLEATTEILEHATVETFPAARIAASALVDPNRCAGVDQSLLAPPPFGRDLLVRAAEVEIERARMFVTAQRPDAVAVAAAARIRAEATSYPPTIGRGLLMEARAEMIVDDARAATTLDRAFRTALAVHDDVTAVEAFARHAYVAAVHGDKPIDGASVIHGIADRLGPEGEFARLLLYNNLAVTRIALSDRGGARDLLTTAIRDWRPRKSDDAFELASIPQNLALVVDQPTESVELLHRARVEVADAVGAGHPKTIELQLTETLFIGDLARARELRDDACTRLNQWFAHLRDERADCEFEAAWLADEANDPKATAAHLAAVTRDPEVGRGRVDVASLFGAALAPGAAREPLAQQLETVGSAWGGSDEMWRRVDGADAWLAAARTWDLAARPDQALRCWTEALAILEPIGLPFVSRRLARTRTALARALVERDPAAAARHARAAATWYQAVGGNGTLVAELVTLAGAPPP